MKKKIFLLMFVVTLAFPSIGRTDFWGGDVVVLTQILAQTIQQLAQLRQLLSTGQDSLDLVRSINQGINDSLAMMQTISPNTSPGIYSQWLQVNQALQGVQGIYGLVVPSTDAPIQKDADQSVAEAISMNNSLYQYTGNIDQIGEAVKEDSHKTSPGGAEKLTAETLGVMLNVMNASLRAQATGIKLQAQSLAIQNHKDKELTQQMLASSADLTGAMQAEPVDFSIPRF